MRTLTPSSAGFRVSLLTLIIAASITPGMAASVSSANSAAGSSPAKSDTASANAQTMTVIATPDDNFKPGGDQLVPAYLDGQIANGGRMGMLGEQRAQDVPFNIVGYTSKMIADQQAQSIADIVTNDPSVQNVQGFGNFSENYRIRGFQLDGDDMSFGGLQGIMPRQVVSTNMIERVEIFKGSNALMNGAGLSGVGGMINLEPKHADDTPLTRLGVDYTSRSQIGTSLDAGRRFGDNNQFGARVNLLQREGDTAVDRDKRRTTLASLGLDYRGDSLRTSLDVGYQKQTYHNGRIGVGITGVNDIPGLPSTTSNYSQKWVYSDIESQFGMARAEYDLTDSWTLYGAMGGQHSHELGAYSSPKLINSNGDATVSLLDTNKYIDAFSGMAGVRGKFNTGFISHSVNVGYSALTKRDKTAWRSGTSLQNTNIYDPIEVPRPTVTGGAGDYSSPGVTARTRTEGVLLSDTLGMLDDRVLLTLGARHQRVEVRNYSYTTGLEDDSSRFIKSRWTPAYGLVVKPWQSISLYANHIEALQPGSAAPNTATNYGQTTGVAHSKQNEVGVKADFGRIGGSLALFDIRKPSGILNSAGAYVLDGEQRHRGVELSLFGEPMLGLRLNGGATWLDPTMVRTAGGTYDGKEPIGVPHYNMVLGAEYDIKPIEGLTATARVNRSGSQYANSANTKKLDSYTTLDLGVRYRMKLQENDMVWRVGVENVTNENYWSSVESYGSYIYQGQPRTLKVSMSYDF